tara:strand:+ start:2641 stop:3216 length:576 start_codon:yes stop_codon:yes gene_type:complete
MKKIMIILLFPIIFSCSKSRTVLICGDHICINKTEANQYFEENLSLEVKIIDKKNKKEFNLVELNLQPNSKNIRKVNIKKKEITNEVVKKLSNDEINKIKLNIKKKKKKKNMKLVKKNTKNVKENKDVSLGKTNKESNKINFYTKEKKNKKKRKEVVDICSLIEKCNIDEISNFLLKQGNKKGFPDITIRQ